MGSGSVGGTLPDVACRSGGLSLSGLTLVTGSLTLDGCTFNLSGTDLLVSKAFTTTGTGGVIMNDTTSVLQLTGPATFGGTGSQLNTGVLVAYGDFVQRGTGTFTPDNAHIVSLLSAQSGAQNQSVTFDDVDKSWFQNLSIALTPGRTVTINSAVKVLGSLIVSGSGGGSLSLPAGLYNQRNGPIAVVGTMGINIGGVINTGSLSFSGGTVTLIGNGTLALGNGSLYLGDNLHLVVNVTGNLVQSLPGQGCTAGKNVTIDGTNQTAVAVLKRACGIE
jgi:hypothetical protein